MMMTKEVTPIVERKPSEFTYRITVVDSDNQSTYAYRDYIDIAFQYVLQLIKMFGTDITSVKITRYPKIKKEEE